MEQLSPQLMHKLVFTVLMHGLNDTQATTAFRLLTEAITNPSTQVRELAVVAIADLSVPAAQRVVALSSALTDKSSRVRRRAARALGEFGPAAEPALSRLVAGLSDRDSSVRRNCAGAVGRLGPVAHAASPRLILMLLEPDGRSKAIATVALKKIGSAAIPSLLEAMREGTKEVRDACAAVLGKIAPGDGNACDFLTGATADADELTWLDEAPEYTDGPPSGVNPVGAGA